MAALPRHSLTAVENGPTSFCACSFETRKTTTTAAEQAELGKRAIIQFEFEQFIWEGRTPLTVMSTFFGRFRFCCPAHLRTTRKTSKKGKKKHLHTRILFYIFSLLIPSAICNWVRQNSLDTRSKWTMKTWNLCWNVSLDPIYLSFQGEEGKKILKTTSRPGVRTYVRMLSACFICQQTDTHANLKRQVQKAEAGI